MKCPFCKHEHDKVVDSRSSGDSIRRRRECLECGKRFTTYEYVESVPLVVKKRDGSRIPFDRQKLVNSFMIACAKRQVSMDQIDKSVDNVREVLTSVANQEAPSEMIGEEVMKQLKALDSVAYVRYASVYREFKDANEFVAEIKHMDD
ncbi:MAG: transcriptional regulator NrdR [Fibrobacterales bacterium]